MNIVLIVCGILHYFMYSKTWDWTSKQSTLLHIRAILILPTNRRQLNWINNFRVKKINFLNKKGDGSQTHRVLQNNSQQTSHFYISKKSLLSFPFSLIKGHTIFKWISTERSVVHWTKYHNWVKNENKIYREEYLTCMVYTLKFLLNFIYQGRCRQIFTF